MIDKLSHTFYPRPWRTRVYHAQKERCSFPASGARRQVSSVLPGLIARGLIEPPSFLESNLHYEVVAGSVASGLAAETSDWDVYGFFQPPNDLDFPGYSKYRVRDPLNGKSYDFTFYPTLRYLRLCVANNPNVIESLFVPDHCVLRCSPVGRLVRQNRHLFLHKGCWDTIEGYYRGKIRSMNHGGFNSKIAYHAARFLDLAEQILSNGNVDLEHNKDYFRSIRLGQRGEKEVRDFLTAKEKEVEELSHCSTICSSPDKAALQMLFQQCVEQPNAILV